MDPYSHTPAGGGAKQPGMTGQVKEEILTRRGEMGIQIEDGALRFQPVLLKSGEFLKEARSFPYFDVDGKFQSLDVPAASLAFTVCQVPVIYQRVSGQAEIRITFASGSSVAQEGNLMDSAWSAELFARSGRIKQIQLNIPANELP